VLMWLRANGADWDEECSVTAAFCGHLPVLMWASANGCPAVYIQSGCAAGEQTCRAAVRGAHLAVLIWARANGYQWGELTVANARELMEDDFLDDDEDPLGWLEASVFAFRIVNSSTRQQKIEAVMEWLQANGCP